MRAFVLFAGLLAAAALGACNPNSTNCLPALPAPARCPPGVFIDPSRGDPTCTDSTTGEPICRGAASTCYICDGPRFTDGCYASSVGTYECVHHCSKC
ncbi:MAG TPA: hypothetical protein VFF06_00915 [Polyangia bacterium]|nr:hypothetical protein [Polyangia bacterium]